MQLVTSLLPNDYLVSRIQARKSMPRAGFLMNTLLRVFLIKPLWACSYYHIWAMVCEIGPFNTLHVTGRYIGQLMIHARPANLNDVMRTNTCIIIITRTRIALLRVYKINPCRGRSLVPRPFFARAGRTAWYTLFMHAQIIP